jgi:hypothetical protein
VIKAQAIPDFPIHNPESQRWRASLIQNVNVVENLYPINDDETDT